MARITLLVVLTVTCAVQGSVKKGVVHWADSYECDDFQVLNNMTWWYDFRMNHEYFHEHKICTSTIDNYNSNYVPMVWGRSKLARINLPEESQFVLGFNEPNHIGQSNISPEEAAAMWKKLERHAEGKLLVSPSAAPCGKKCRSNDEEWFDRFFELCKDCRVDYIAAHTYWCNVNKVMGYLKRLSKRYNRKVWLTEFACKETEYEMEQLEFMEQILPQLEAADFVFRYSWYSARIKESGFVKTSASLLVSDRSELTELGRYYNNFQGSSSSESSTIGPISSTEYDTEVPGREETFLILLSFTSNPTKWWKILNFMKKYSFMLPPAVHELYMSSSKMELRQRIRKQFKNVICADINEFEDIEIRELLETIKNMPEQGKRRKNAGELRVPKC